jgi:hypothetical protein
MIIESLNRLINGASSKSSTSSESSKRAEAFSDVEGVYTVPLSRRTLCSETRDSCRSSSRTSVARGELVELGRPVSRSIAPNIRRTSPSNSSILRCKFASPGCIMCFFRLRLSCWLLHGVWCKAHAWQTGLSGGNTQRTFRLLHSAQLCVPRRMRFGGVSSDPKMCSVMFVRKCLQSG